MADRARESITMWPCSPWIVARRGHEGDVEHVGVDDEGRRRHVTQLVAGHERAPLRAAAREVRTRPDIAPVSRPSRTAGTPLTKTWSTPIGA
ncbi:hypothetical protein SAMN04488561_6890 [Jiangella alba]|uniref:Uncharacterized protein n=1 Tax=Jiangella alba TaxID=561176 RepID=A0A1H5PYN4_9ACTN|nr:hypothetical protein SAMN04488561_6890 [Jiangella alba]